METEKGVEGADRSDKTRALFEIAGHLKTIADWLEYFGKKDQGSL